MSNQVIAVSTSPGVGGFAITPSDSEDLIKPVRGIYVGTTGDLKVTKVNGDIMDYPNIAAGVIHPIAAKRVWATGTTASDLRGEL